MSDVLSQPGTGVQQGGLQSGGTFRLSELRLQVRAEMILILEWAVTKRAMGPYDKLQALLDQGSLLDRGQKGRIGLERSKGGHDCLCLRLAEGVDCRDRGLEGVEITQSRLLVEGRAFRGRSQAIVEFGVCRQALDCRHAQYLA